jgi:D-alanyl-D-alanine dipeptidase
VPGDQPRHRAGSRRIRARVGAALAAAAVAALAACASGPQPSFVRLADLAPGISQEMRYAEADNFVGAPIDGYERPVCLLSAETAQALAAVQQELVQEGLGLRVFDCYRPARAVAHFAHWARDLSDQHTKPEYYPRVDKTQLFAEGYIAERSGHSRGSTVDVTLVGHRPDGGLVELDMGTPFDLFDPRSATASPEVSEVARANRVRLREHMERGGFRNLPQEWWHYTLADEPYPDRYFDVPVR